jgi:hypothetical protein
VETALIEEDTRPVDFFSLPYWLLMAAFVTSAVAAACGLHAAVQRTVPYAKLVEHNEVAGFMIALVGVLYSVLIAFVVVVVWQQYNEADANYGREVSTAADIFAQAPALPQAEMRTVRTLVDRYVAEMIDEEWPAMRSASASDAATSTLTALSRSTAVTAVGADLGVVARVHLAESVQHLFDLRNRRLADNAETLPPVLWAALLFGAGITVGFGFLFGVVNQRIQLIMTGAVAALIAIMFTLLVELDFPFRRDTAIPVQRWLELQRYLVTRPTALPSANSDARAMPR